MFLRPPGAVLGLTKSYILTTDDGISSGDYGKSIVGYYSLLLLTFEKDF